MDAPTTRERLPNWRRRVLILLVSSLFVVSFVESYAALERAAVEAAIPWPQAWPWQVDGFILATALMVIEARDRAHRWGAWWPRLGLFASTGLSTVIQAVYAPDGAAWLHAWSPLAVLFSFECLVWLTFTAWRPNWPIPDRPPAEQSEPEPADDPAEPDSDEQPTRPNNRTRWSPADDPRVLAGLAAGRSPHAIKNELGLSDRRYRALLHYRDEQQATLVPSRNGQGGGP
jgi:hypothetical protein